MVRLNQCARTTWSVTSLKAIASSISSSLQKTKEKISTGGGAQGPHYMKSPRYQTMTARLQSFREFPRSVNITPKQFAVAGLFYTGDGDLCRCFTCDGGLKTWDADDDPIREHALYFPNCSYIKNLKGPNYIRRIQAERLNQKTEGTRVGGYNNGATSGVHTKVPVSGAGAVAGHASTAGSQVPGVYSDPEVTSNTNEHSEHTINQVSQKLGFSESEVITAKVALEIKGNREPTMSDIMNMLLDMKEEEERQEEQRKSDAEKEPSITTMVKENEMLSQQMYCMLCVTGEANVLFLPCTHHRVCTSCVKDITHCPICNRRVEEKVRTYRS